MKWIWLNVKIVKSNFFGKIQLWFYLSKNTWLCYFPLIFFLFGVFSSFLNFLFFYLFTWKSRDRHRQKVRSHLMTHFTPQAPKTGLRQSQSQEPGLQFESPTWVSGSQLLEPSTLTTRVCVSGKIELKTELQLESRHSDRGCQNLKWHPSHYVTHLIK